MPSNQSAHCSQCQQPLTVGSSELVCPECRDGLKALLVNETEGTASVKPNVQWDTLAASLPDRDFLRTLGSGGMGQVFLVRHRRLDRLEALKVLLPDLAKSGSNTLSASKRSNRRCRTRNTCPMPPDPSVLRKSRSGSDAAKVSH